MDKTVRVLDGDITAFYRFESPVEGDYSARHCHDGYEMLYITEGQSRFIIEGDEYSMRPGTIVLIPPFTYHYLELEDRTVYSRYVAHFPASELPSAVGDIFASKFGARQPVLYFPPSCIPQHVAGIMERIGQAGVLPQDERYAMVHLLIGELMLILATAGTSVQPRDNGELGGRVIRYLNDNIDRNISLDELSKRFFISKYYLCRAFKRYNGISVHGYINQKRVMYAKQLIESGETASGAAYRVGFGDYSAFYRAYVKLLGCAPTDTATKQRGAALTSVKESDTENERI